MFNIAKHQTRASRPLIAAAMSAESEVNAINSEDRFDAAEAMPKPEYRRSWRRRRIRRGKT